MATSPAHIRQAVHEDAEAVARLVTELGYPTTMAQMRERLRTILSDRDYMTFVAESNCGVLGVAGASIDPYFEKMAFTPAWSDLPFLRPRVREASARCSSTRSNVGAPAKAHEKWSSTAGSTAPTRMLSTNDVGLPAPACGSSNSCRNQLDDLSTWPHIAEDR